MILVPCLQYVVVDFVHTIRVRPCNFVHTIRVRPCNSTVGPFQLDVKRISGVTLLRPLPNYDVPALLPKQKNELKK